MKNLLNALILGLASGLGAGGFRAAADLEVSAGVTIHAKSDFDAPLAAHGTWVEVAPYGRCWRPAGVTLEWRPYSYGSWVWTDCGWYWASDEPWGWACYHYGSWVFSDGAWVWVPGIEWAPAWVEWRVGGGFVGWAPFPPPGVILAPPLFVFVDAHRFLQPFRPGGLIVNNTAIINKTTQITELKRETRSFEGARQQVLINNGPGVSVIQKATGKELSAVPIREAVLKTSAPEGLKQSRPEPTGRERPANGPTQPTLSPERNPPSGPPPARTPGRSRERVPGNAHGRDKL